MSIVNINREELQNSLTHLEQALYNHLQWHKGVIRTISCRLQSDRHDVGLEAHKECLFGQWYYDQAPKKLQAHPGFKVIGEAHQHMHQLAAQILKISNSGSIINPNDYNNFSNAVERLQLEINSMKRELEIMLYTRDPLTGTINRIDMMPVLRELHEMAKRNSLNCSLVMVDLDEFKKINDKYGHPAGDKVLIAFSHYLIDNLRPYDKIFRFGGEEFLLCLQQIELMPCYKKCENIREGLAKILINIDQDELVHITASFGITTLDPTISIEECIERSDKAMYAAKAAGRNYTRIWDQSLSRPS